MMRKSKKLKAQVFPKHLCEVVTSRKAAEVEDTDRLIFGAFEEGMYNIIVCTYIYILYSFKYCANMYIYIYVYII